MSNSDEEFRLRRGPWTVEEDTLLIHYINCNGEGRWNLLAKCAGLKRTGKSCRLRWLNYLKPDIKRGNLTPKEQLLILELHSKWGNRWSKIAQNLPGRTDNEIKNYWRTRVQKQARQLNIDSNSKKFLEAIRCFWMPRLLEKIEQSSSLPSSSSSSSISTMEPQNSTSPPQETNNVPIKLNNINPLNEQSCPSIYSPDLPQTLKWQESHAQDSPFYSMKISQQPEILEKSASFYQGFAQTDYKNSILDDCYHVDISNFDMEGFNQRAMSEEGSDEFLLSETQIAVGDWINDDMEATFWNMDELWQFKKTEEVVEKRPKQGILNPLPPTFQ
ncbi:unnamed protein product [Ilex paraguariensis]|uniref:Uncharacterized protein n=1 Tax=Ilex paraguariensis TaxID=185542 RepID=A0ABC8RWR8_9AQUA